MATSSGKASQEGRTLLGYLHNSKYSDIKVLVGPDKSPFYLHRIVITTKSAYFQTICDGAFEESQTREIWLEEMEPEIFKIIVAWMYIYGGINDYNVRYNAKNLVGFMDWDNEKVVDLYAAADYLQISDLKVGVLKWAAGALRLMPGLMNVGTEPKPYQVIQNLCVHSQLSDWALLRECVRNTKPSVHFQPSDLVELSKGEPGSGFLLAMMVEINQAIINRIVCVECQIKYNLSLREDAPCIYWSNLCIKAPLVTQEDLWG